MISRYELMQAGSGQRYLERNDEYGHLVKFEDYERLRAALTTVQRELAINGYRISEETMQLIDSTLGSQFEEEAEPDDALRAYENGSP